MVKSLGFLILRLSYFKHPLCLSPRVFSSLILGMWLKADWFLDCVPVLVLPLFVCVDLGLIFLIYQMENGVSYFIRVIVKINQNNSHVILSINLEYSSAVWSSGSPFETDRPFLVGLPAWSWAQCRDWRSFLYSYLPSFVSKQASGKEISWHKPVHSSLESEWLFLDKGSRELEFGY